MNAWKKYLLRGHKTVMLNPYTLKNDQLANIVDKSYIETARSAPRAFGVVYKLGDLYRSRFAPLFIS